MASRPSRRVAAVYDRQGLWTAWPALSHPDPPCPTQNGAKPSKSNDCPTCPTCPSLSTVADGESLVTTATPDASDSRSQLSSELNPKSGGTGGTGRTKPATPRLSDCPTAASGWDRWDNLDGWRDRWREAQTVDLRREVVAVWAAAADGEVRDGTLHLPRDLPRRLVRAEMTANAGYVGLAVAEVSPPSCAWCPEPAAPGSGSCDHRGWLAGTPSLTPCSVPPHRRAAGGVP